MRLLSSPVPIAGRTKLEVSERRLMSFKLPKLTTLQSLQLELLDLPEIPRLTIAYSEHTRFHLVDFPLHLPLGKFD